MGQVDPALLNGCFHLLLYPTVNLTFPAGPKILPHQVLARIASDVDGFDLEVNLALPQRVLLTA